MQTIFLHFKLKQIHFRIWKVDNRKAPRCFPPVAHEWWHSQKMFQERAYVSQESRRPPEKHELCIYQNPLLNRLMTVNKRARFDKSIFTRTLCLSPQICQICRKIPPKSLKRAYHGNRILICSQIYLTRMYRRNHTRTICSPGFIVKLAQASIRNPLCFPPVDKYAFTSLLYSYGLLGGSCETFTICKK